MPPKLYAVDEEKGREDCALLARIREGDTAAFAQLVARHAERSYRIAYRFTANREQAEDMVQSAFVKLWEQPRLWQEGRGASFGTWFTRVVINRCLDAKRRAPMLPLELAVNHADGSIAADDQLAHTQQQRQLEIEIAKLPPRQRTALNLCFYEEYSNAEAAAIMQLPVKALQSLLMRAKQTLKDRLQEPPHA